MVRAITANSGGVTTGFTLSATPSGGSAAVVPDSAYDPRYSHATYSKTDDTGGVSLSTRITLNVSTVASHPGKTLAGCSYVLDVK